MGTASSMYTSAVPTNSSGNTDGSKSTRFSSAR